MEDEKNVAPINAVTVQTSNVQNLEMAIQQAENFVKLQDRIRKMAVNLTNTNDWIDQNGTPYLQASGCSKIAGAFGLRVYGVETVGEKDIDDKGEFLIYNTSGYSAWNGNEVHEIGSATSRDDFFAKRKDDNGNSILLPLQEIDRADIRKKSHTNFMNRIIKRQLGLTYTWEELAEASSGKITKEKCGSVKYEKGRKGGSTDTDPKTKDHRAELRNKVLEMAGGDTKTARTMLETFSQWTNKKGELVAGKTNVDQLSEKQVNIVLDKVRKEYDEMFPATPETEDKKINKDDLPE